MSRAAASWTHVRAVVAAVALLAVPAGGCRGGGGGPAEAAEPRCAQCGMRADLAPEFRAGATDAEGRAVHFDAPKCLFRWLAGDRGRGARDAWVTEYYGQARRPAGDVRYVVGSDLLSPMGHDLVPVEGAEAAARFAREHGGDRVLTRDEVTPAVVEALDAR